MEFVWQGSPTLKGDSEIFTHVLHTHYSAPQVTLHTIIIALSCCCDLE